MVEVLSIPVPAPLPDITMHIMQAPGVGAIAADGGSIDEPIARRDGALPIGILFAGRRILDVPDLGQGLRVVAVEIPRSRAGTASIFPLGLSGKTVGLALLPAQPLGEGHGVVPAHVDHRVKIGLLETGLTPGV